MIGRLHQRLQTFLQLAPWRGWLASNYVSGLLVVFASWGMFFTYLWPQILFFNEKGLQAGWVGVWGDWAAHITYANLFALRPPSMWLTPHPIHLNSDFTSLFSRRHFWIVNAWWYECG